MEFLRHDEDIYICINCQEVFEGISQMSYWTPFQYCIYECKFIKGICEECDKKDHSPYKHAWARFEGDGLGDVERCATCKQWIPQKF